MAADLHVLFRMIGEIKVSSDGLDVSLSFLLTPRRCSLKRFPSLLPVSPMYLYMLRIFEEVHAFNR